jgi:antitoxin component of MazEF toxin-antitoxin module
VASIGLKRVLFGTTLIQRQRRVALDPNLLKNLGLEIGDEVAISLDIETKTICIEKVVPSASSGDRRKRR